MISNSAQITFSKLPGMVVEVTDGWMKASWLGIEISGNLDPGAGLGLIESNAMELLKCDPRLERKMKDFVESS